MGNLWRGLVVAVSAVALGGCWLQPGFGPEHQSYNPFESTLTPANVGSLHQVWSVPAPFAGPPLVANGTVVYGGYRYDNGTIVVQAVARATGAVRWQRQFNAPLFTTSASVLSVAGGRVVVVRPEAIVSLDLATGATLATAEEPGQFGFVDDVTAVAGSDVIAYRTFRQVTGEWVLVVRSRTTLEELWTAPIGPYSLREHGPIVISQGRIELVDSTETELVVKSFPVDGCGAATCAPTTAVPVPQPDDPSARLGSAVLMAATDDGGLIVTRTFVDDRAGLVGYDVVQLADDGTIEWSLPRTTADGVAVAGDTTYLLGNDPATPTGRSLIVRSATSTWRADVEGLRGTPVVAGGLVYLERLTDTGGTDVAVFDAAGCGAPVCDEIRTIDAGPSSDGLYGMAVTAGMLFVHKAGAAGAVIAYRP